MASTWQKNSFFSRSGFVQVLEQPRRGGGHTDVPPGAPLRHALPDPVDALVLLNAILGPLRFEPHLPAMAPRSGDRHEIGADPSRLNDVWCDSLLVEAEVPRRLGKCRVENRLFDRDLGHDVRLCSHYRLRTPWCSRQTDRRHSPSASGPAFGSIRVIFACERATSKVRVLTHLTPPRNQEYDTKMSASRRPHQGFNSSSG